MIMTIFYISKMKAKIKVKDIMNTLQKMHINTIGIKDQRIKIKMNKHLVNKNLTKISTTIKHDMIKGMDNFIKTLIMQTNPAIQLIHHLIQVFMLNLYGSAGTFIGWLYLVFFFSLIIWENFTKKALKWRLNKSLNKK